MCNYLHKLNAISEIFVHFVKKKFKILKGELRFKGGKGLKNERPG
jgi:hypothetical protein